MTNNIIATIQGVSVNLIEGSAGEEVVEYVAGMMIDNDGSGGNPDHDPYHQNDTTLHDPQGTALNAYQVPFIVVPPVICQKTKGKVLGSLARVINTITLQFCDAVVGDIGPHLKIGEASPRCARSVSVNPNAVSGGVAQHIIRYQIYVGKPATINGVTYHLKSYGA